MPRPRSTQAYPAVFGEMIDRVASRGEEFRHKCPDNSAAQKLRFTFYDYIKACKRSDIPQDIQRADMAAGLMFTIEGEYLVIKSRDTTGEALALQASLDKYMGQSFQEAEVKVPRQQTSSKQVNELPPVTPGPSQEDLINSYMTGKKK